MKDDLNHVLANLRFEPKEAAVYKVLAETQRSIFEMAWDFAGRQHPAKIEP